MELTEEYIHEHNLQYGSSYCFKDTLYEFISKELDDYYEGTCYYTIVVKNKETGKYYAFTHWNNSWTDYENNEYDPYEVEPVEVTITQYKRVKSS